MNMSLSGYEEEYQGGGTFVEELPLIPKGCSPNCSPLYIFSALPSLLIKEMYSPCEFQLK